MHARFRVNIAPRASSLYVLRHVLCCFHDLYVFLMLVLARCAAQDRWTALHWAASYGRLEAIKILVELKADLEARTTVRHIPLPYCA